MAGLSDLKPMGRAASDGDPERRYLDQLRQRALEVERARRSRESEGSTEWTDLDQYGFDGRWDGMTLADAMQATGSNGERLVDNRFNELTLAEDDPLIAQFRQQYGDRSFVDENGNPIEAPDSGNARAAGYMMGYGDPTYGLSGGADILQDSSRVLRLPDGRYIREAGNLNSGEIAGAQRAEETRSRQLRQRGAIMAGSVLAGGLAYNALGAGAGAGGADWFGAGGLAPEEAAGLAAGDVGGGAGGAGAFQEVGGLDMLSPEGIPAANPALSGAPGGGGPGITEWIRANPAQAARYGLNAVGALSGAAGGGGGGGSGGGGGGALDTTSPLRRTAAGNAGNGSTGNMAYNPNAPMNTAAGSANAPIDTSGSAEMVMTTQGPMPASSVTGYVGQEKGGSDMAINPQIQSILDIGNERVNRYRDRFIPLEDLIVDEASGAGSLSMQEERAASAAEDVSGQFRRARGAGRRNLMRGGVNPFSAQGQAIETGLDREEAAARSSGMNVARRAERDSGFGKRLAAAGMGDKAISQGLSSLSGGVEALLDQDRTTASRENTAASVGAQIAGIQSREREGAAERAQRANEFGEGTRRWGLEFGDSRSRFNLGRGDRRYEFDTRTGLDRDRYATDDEHRRAVFNRGGDQYEDTQRRERNRDIGGLISGVGQFAGSPAGQAIGTSVGNWWDSVDWGGYAKGGRVKGYAEGGLAELEILEGEDGGAVEGPGTETSDSIPAYLSNNEFVLPAEATKIVDQLDPGLLERLRKLGLKVREMGDQMERGETFEGEYEAMED